MKLRVLIASVWLLTIVIAGLAHSQEPLSESAYLEPFPEDARTDEWSFSLEPNQMATYTVDIAPDGVSPDEKTYTFQSSDNAVLPPGNINTIWVWTVSGSGQNYVCQVANTHWLEAETTVTISCTWAREAEGGTGDGPGGGLDVIPGRATGIVTAIEADMEIVSLEIDGAPDYLCINETMELHSWLVLGEYPYDDWQPVDAIWTVEPVGQNGGDGVFIPPQPYDSVATFVPTQPGEVRVTASVPEGSGTLEANVTFIIYEVQSITSTPKGAEGYGNLLPDPIWIGAGALESDAHQADVKILVHPPVAGIPIDVWLEGGIGHEESARMEMNGPTAFGGMDSVEVLTGSGGEISGTLTSSDSIDTCTIQACEKQTNIVFNWVTQFDPETDWLLEPGFLPVPGVLTNEVRFRHHRGVATNLWKPFDQHEIHFFVERVEWFDTNGVLQVVNNTPDNPSTNVNGWAVFDDPNSTDEDGWVTAKLTVFDKPGLYSVTLVAYDAGVWEEPPSQPQPMGMMTLMSQQLDGVRERSPSVDTAKSEYSIHILLDANNDGEINEDDEPLKAIQPGKILWADKDAAWRGDNPFNAVDPQYRVAEIELTLYGAENNVVPDGYKVGLRWKEYEGRDTIDLFEDAQCTVPITVSNGETVWRYYEGGQVLPSTIYARASTTCLTSEDIWARAWSGWPQEIRATLRKLDLYSLVNEDSAYVYIANTPSETPANRDVVLWHEDLSLTWSEAAGEYIAQNENLMNSVRSALIDDLADEGQHSNLLNVQWLRRSDDTQTLEQFLDLKNAGILVSCMHGMPGRVNVTAFSRTDVGHAAAQTWVSEFNAGDVDYAAISDSPLQNVLFVVVTNTFFAAEWSSARNSNRAIMLTATCHSAEPGEGEIPSFIESVGGSFARGREGIDSPGSISSYAKSMILRMRQSGWRTVLGAYHLLNPVSEDRIVGVGKTTLWPAPIFSYSPGMVKVPVAFPHKMTEDGCGIANIVLDTMVAKTSSPSLVGHVDGQLTWSGGVTWYGPFSGLLYSHAFRRPFIGAQSPKLRVNSVYCLSRFPASMPLAGDGESCGRPLDWEVE